MSKLKVLMMTLAVVGCLAAEAETNNLARPPAAKRNRGIPFLGGNRPMRRGTVERAVAEGGFSVQVPGDWAAEPTVRTFPSNVTIKAQKRYRFAGKEKTEWLSVEHVAFADTLSMTKDIGTWYGAQLALAGGKAFDAPDGVEVEVGPMRSYPYEDARFKAKHKADAMSAHDGTVMIGGVAHSVFVACLAHGHEAWKIEVVIPSPAKGGAARGKPGRPSLAAILKASAIFGGFQLREPTAPAVAAKGREVTEEDIDTFMVFLSKLDSKGRDKAFRCAPPQLLKGVVSRLLVKAVTDGALADVKDLLGCGANPNYKDNRGVTPLGQAVTMFAMNKQGAEIAEALLDAGADANGIWGTMGNVTPLYSLVQMSCFTGEFEKHEAACLALIRKLAEKGADPNRAYGLAQRSALGYAVMRGAKLSLVKTLVECGGKVTEQMVQDADKETKPYLTEVLAKGGK